MPQPKGKAMLKASEVRDLLEKCLYDDEMPGDEPPKDAVLVEGILHTFGFHPERLENKPRLIELLRDLPDEFMKDKGGGHSFLAMCMDRHGNHWAEHPTMEILMCLAIGAGLAKYSFPREIWGSLPGGMPYFHVDLPPPA